MATLSPSDPAYRYDDPTSHAEADEDYTSSALPATGVTKASPASRHKPAASSSSRSSASDEGSLSSGESSGIEDDSHHSGSDEAETDAEARALEEDLLDADDVAAAGQPSRKEWVMNALSKGGRSRGQSYRTVQDADADTGATRTSHSGSSRRSARASAGGSSGRSAARSSSGRGSRRGSSYYDIGSGAAASGGAGAGSGVDPAQLEKGLGGPDYRDSPSSSATTVKKPWYKKWWVWLLVVVAVIAVICAVAAAVVASNASYTSQFESLLGGGNGTSTSSTMTGSLADADAALATAAAVGSASAVLGWITTTGADGAQTSVLGTLAASATASATQGKENVVVTHGASSMYASNAGLVGSSSYNAGIPAATTAKAATATGTVSYNNGAYTPWSEPAAATMTPAIGQFGGGVGPEVVSTASGFDNSFGALSVFASGSIPSGPVAWASASMTATAVAEAAPPTSTGMTQGAFSWQQYVGSATYFDSSHHYTVCGLAPADTDFVVAVASSVWSTSHCGQQAVVTNLANGISVNVWVSEECAYCQGPQGVDLSQAAFEAISGGELSVGALNVAWGFLGTNSEVTAANGQQTSITGTSPILSPTASGAVQPWAASASTTPAAAWPTTTSTSSSSAEPTIYLGQAATTAATSVEEGYTAAVVSAAAWWGAATTITTTSAWDAMQATATSIPNMWTHSHATTDSTAWVDDGNPWVRGTTTSTPAWAASTTAAAAGSASAQASSSSASGTSSSAMASWSVDNLDS